MIKWLVLIDLENLLMTLGPTIEGYSFITRLGIAFEKLRERGEIVLGIIFTPRHLIKSYEDFFLPQSFLIVYCPKKSNEEDSTDEQLIFLGQKLISLPGITHLCLGSGDGHFQGLAKQAKQKKLRISSIVGNIHKLSLSLSKLIDTLPDTQRKDIIVLETMG